MGSNNNFVRSQTLVLVSITNVGVILKLLTNAAVILFIFLKSKSDRSVDYDLISYQTVHFNSVKYEPLSPQTVCLNSVKYAPL